MKPDEVVNTAIAVFMWPFYILGLAVGLPIFFAWEGDEQLEPFRPSVTRSDAQENNDG